MYSVVDISKPEPIQPPPQQPESVQPQPVQPPPQQPEPNNPTKVCAYYFYEAKVNVAWILFSRKMNIKPDRHINLLLIGKGENRHYCLIKNFSGLMRNTKGGHTIVTIVYIDLHSKKLSVSILNSATGRKLQFSHKPEDKEVSFKNTKRQLPITFIIYADFEAYTTKINESHPGHTTMYQRHMPLGFGYMVVSTDPH